MNPMNSKRKKSEYTKTECIIDSCFPERILVWLYLDKRSPWSSHLLQRLQFLKFRSYRFCRSRKFGSSVNCCSHSCLHPLRILTCMNAWIPHVHAAVLRFRIDSPPCSDGGQGMFSRVFFCLENIIVSFSNNKSFLLLTA